MNPQMCTLLNGKPCNFFFVPSSLQLCDWFSIHGVIVKWVSPAFSWALWGPCSALGYFVNPASTVTILHAWASFLIRERHFFALKTVALICKCTYKLFFGFHEGLLPHERCVLHSRTTASRLMHPSWKGRRTEIIWCFLIKSGYSNIRFDGCGISWHHHVMDMEGGGEKGEEGGERMGGRGRGKMGGRGKEWDGWRGRGKE